MACLHQTLFLVLVSLSLSIQPLQAARSSKEIHERIEYSPGSGQRVLFPDAELQMCGESSSSCETKRVSVRISLATNHIGKGCDRDTYSLESQRKLCGASSESVDLLPSPGIGSEWTRDLPTDEGRQSDQIYSFDGTSNAVVIPESVLNHNLSDKFSVSFWMKHEPPASTYPPSHHGSSGNKEHIKEHILCNADDHKKNRHHYSLFVRNCRLIFLMRRESSDESEEPEKSVFRPAEWRWKLNEVCDNQWHHFSVSLDFPDVTLYVDGQRFKNTSSNPEIVDDWPLHSVRGVKTTLVVGACWEGRDSKMNFHFKGYLAGLSVLRGQNEKPQVLSCLHQCKEGLQLPPPDSLDPGTDVSINSESTAVLIEGRDTIDVEDILSQITYLNSREFPTPGRRSLRLSTSVKCSNGKSVKIPVVDSYLMVLPPEQPSITLNGTPNLAREYEAFVQGIEPFSTVSILVNREQETEENQADDDEAENDDDTSSKLTTEHRLDSCSVQVYPPLNPDHEYFRLPVNFMEHLGVHYRETRDGLVIHGADSIHSYQTILQQIVYFNRKPAYYLNRAFKLSCSELNGRFSSNDYIQTLTVIHPKIEKKDISTSTAATHQVLVQPALVAKAQVHNHRVEAKESKVSSAGFLDSGLMDVGTDTVARASNTMNSRLSPIVVGHAVTVIIVVCVGFLVFMIVLGVIRIRAAHHRAAETREEDQEMTWDDTALTITVNPLDQIEQEEAETQPMTGGEDDGDSDSSGGSSYHEDGESSEDEEPEPKSKSDMAWDDSALNF